MTAGKVMAAIKVDMCRQQPTVPQIVAPRPSIVDLVRRRRGNARVCLFGVPEPGATRKIYDEMLAKQHKYMLNRWQFDMKTDRFVGEEETPTEQGSNDVPAVIQNRLQGEEGKEQTTQEELDSGESQNRLDTQQSEEQAEEEAASISPSNSSEASSINDAAQLPQSAQSSSTHVGRIKCPDGSSSPQPRNVAMKPYDKNVRPITGTKKKPFE